MRGAGAQSVFQPSSNNKIVSLKTNLLEAHRASVEDPSYQYRQSIAAMASTKNAGGVSSVLSQAKKEILENALHNPDSTIIRHRRFFSN